MEVVLIAATQRDIQRRPADRIRGPKLLWRVIATQNVVGPAVCYGLGRRRGRYGPIRPKGHQPIG